MNTKSPYRGGKSLLVIIALTMSSQLLQGEFGSNTAVVQAISVDAEGIFDRFVKKMGEKE